MAAPTVRGSLKGSLKSPRLLLDSFCLSHELLRPFPIASLPARAGEQFWQGESPPAWRQPPQTGSIEDKGRGDEDWKLGHRR